MSMDTTKIKAGIEKRRAEGKRIGRPPAITPGNKAKIVSMHVQGFAVRAIALAVGLSVGTVHAVIVQFRYGAPKGQRDRKLMVEQADAGETPSASGT